eukprot:SM000031S11580  [mRNA]  locus=s31:411010:411594:+ [translate_table: standard]
MSSASSNKSHCCSLLCEECHSKSDLTAGQNTFFGFRCCMQQDKEAHCLQGLRPVGYEAPKRSQAGNCKDRAW